MAILEQHYFFDHEQHLFLILIKLPIVSNEVYLPRPELIRKLLIAGPPHQSLAVLYSCIYLRLHVTLRQGLECRIYFVSLGRRQSLLVDGALEVSQNIFLLLGLLYSLSLVLQNSVPVRHGLQGCLRLTSFD